MYGLAVRDPVTDLVHRRTLAGWVDVLVLALVAIVISAASGDAHIGSWTSYTNGVEVSQHGFQFNLSGGGFVLWFVLALLYYGVDEALTGQTVGKRLFGLKVIKVNGHALDPGSVALRTIGRVIDVLPAFYLLGWILMRGPRRPPQRIGDRIAGTTVVHVSHPS
jgi:uncharacterized RDD family membrane protein YckC